MRTLKKVLALSLVFAMAFTMMAGAAFKDQDKINTALNDDIQLMTALGVFQGDENGNFEPTANVTRAQAAKMIYVLKNNGVDDNAVAFQGVSQYSDVPVGHWAEGYINYSTNLGYMNGWSENGVKKFDPNGNVTGVELGKMLLCMIGYKSDIQGYTGANWKLNVQQDASEAGIFLNFEPSIYAATPRQWTARLLTNAVNATYVTYTKGELVYGTNQNGGFMSYGSKYLNLVVDKGQLTATQYVTLDNGSIKNTLKESNNKYSTVQVGANPVRFAYAADKELLGQNVKVYYRGTKIAGADDYKVYAIMADNSQNIINTTSDAVTYDSSNSKKVTIKDNGTKTYGNGTAGNNPVNLYVDGAKVAGPVAIDDVAIKGAYLGINSTTPVKLILDDKGYITDVFVTSLAEYAIVSNVDTTRGTLKLVDGSTSEAPLYLSDGTGVKALSTSSTNSLSLSSTNKDNLAKYVNFVDTVAKGDVVAITRDTSNGKLVYNIAKAQTVSGTVSKYTLNSANNAYSNITIGGETYKFANIIDAGNPVYRTAMHGYDITTATGKVPQDKTFYTDGKHIVFSTGGNATATVSDLAYIIGAEFKSSMGKNAYRVEALLADGTVGTYDVNEVQAVDGTKLPDDTALQEKFTASHGTYIGDKGRADVGTVFHYSISGGKITLRTLETPVGAIDASKVTFLNAATLAYDKTTKQVTGTGVVATMTVDDNSYFFVRSKTGNDAKYSVVKANELPGKSTSNNAAVYAAQRINGLPTLSYGVLTLDSAPTASVQYALVSSSASYESTEAGKHIVKIDVVENGVTKTLSVEFSSYAQANNAIVTLNGMKGKLVTFEADSNGLMDGANAIKLLPNGDKATSSTVVKEKWNQLQITGWNGTSASAKGVFANAPGTEVTLNVASDVKVMYVNAEFKTNSTAFDGVKYVEDGVVVKTDLTVNADQNFLPTGLKNASAVAYVKEINNVLTITDIVVEVDGENIDYAYNATLKPNQP